MYGETRRAYLRKRVYPIALVYILLDLTLLYILHQGMLALFITGAIAISVMLWVRWEYYTLFCRGIRTRGFNRFRHAHRGAGHVTNIRSL